MYSTSSEHLTYKIQETLDKDQLLKLKILAVKQAGEAIKISLGRFAAVMGKFGEAVVEATAVSEK